jgi:ABC-type branched-subunit amino acid transport system substrate-binding protein
MTQTNVVRGSARKMTDTIVATRPKVTISSSALFLLVGLALVGCTLIATPDTEQCDKDADCAQLGPTFEGFVCERHVCVETENSCKTFSDCNTSKDDALATCVEGVCVQLTSEDCPEVVPADAVGEGTIFIGSMGPLKGEYVGNGLPIVLGATLALEELDERANGLPLGESGARRRIAMIKCHDLDDPLRVAEHLIEKVRVPAIIGPAFSGIALSVAQEVSIPAGTLLLSASATSPAITDLDDDGLVWRTAPSDALQAVPITALVQRFETRLRAERELTDSDGIKVAVVAKGDAYGTGLFDAVTSTMRFNGKTAADNGGNFLGINYKDPSLEKVDFSTHVTSLVEFEPDLVLGLGTAEVVQEIMGPLENAWPTSGPPKPYYLFPDGGHVPDLLELAEADPSLFTRVLGTVPGRKGSNYDAFALRYKARFENVVPGTFAETGYDAAYLLAYAMLAAGNSEVTGKRIAAGLGKMSDGPRVVARPDQINAAITALASGGGIQFEGASGSLDFNAKTGEAPADVEIWCVLDEKGTALFESSGEYYDAKSGEIAGSNEKCNL